MELQLKNSTYDVINSFVRHIMPGAAAAYFALAEIWGFPYAQEVVGTVAIVTTFLGLILYLAKRGWQADGTIEVGDGESAFGLRDGRLLEDLQENEVITMRAHKRQ